MESSRGKAGLRHDWIHGFGPCLGQCLFPAHCSTVLVFHSQVAATCSRLTFFSSTSTVENPCLLPDSSRKSLVHPPVGPCSGHLLIPPQALGQRLKYYHGPGLNNMFYPEARSGVSPTHSTGIKNKAGCFPERQPTQRLKWILS